MVASAGRVESINTSSGGVPKASAFEARLTVYGVTGDTQANTDHHGGPDRAVTLFGLEVIRRLQAEGHAIAPGSTGENLTISGLDWPSLTPGQVLQIGDARVQITRYATPCSKIAASFRDRDFLRVSHDHHPGWSRLCARVLTPGTVRPGDPVTLVG